MTVFENRIIWIIATYFHRIVEFSGNIVGKVLNLIVILNFSLYFESSTFSILNCTSLKDLRGVSRALLNQKFSKPFSSSPSNRESARAKLKIRRNYANCESGEAWQRYGVVNFPLCWLLRDSAS